LALARSLGFIKIDEVIDEIDGLEYVYMLEQTPSRCVLYVDLLQAG
jgi:hypothetical protein